MTATTARLVLGSRCIQTQTAIGSAADDHTVVIVLPIILPPALGADVVPTALIERSMTATRARVRTTFTASEDVLLAYVHPEPLATLSEKLVITQRWVIVRTSDHSRHGLIVAPVTHAYNGISSSECSPRQAPYGVKAYTIWPSADRPTMLWSGACNAVVEADSATTKNRTSDTLLSAMVGTMMPFRATVARSPLVTPNARRTCSHGLSAPCALRRFRVRSTVTARRSLRQAHPSLRVVRPPDRT